MTDRGDASQQALSSSGKPFSQIRAKMRRAPRSGAAVVAFETLSQLIVGDGSAEDVHALLANASNKQQLLVQREDGWTLLHTACSRGKLYVAYALLQEGAECDAPTPKGATPLHFLSLLTRDECVPSGLYLQLLAEMVRQGADVHGASANGETCLHMAASRRNEGAVSFFIEQGCAVDAVTKQGDTPLHYAITQGSAAVVSLLLAADASVDIVNAKHVTALDLATQPGTDEEVAALLLGFEGRANVVVPEEAGALVCIGPDGRSGSPSAIAGSWDAYRNDFFGRKHYVYWACSDRDNALAIVLARPEGGRFRGLLVHGAEWAPFSFDADQVSLYRALEEPERVRQVLRTLRVVNVWDGVEWTVARHAGIASGVSLLVLETRLGLRPRLCIGVVYGEAGQHTEAEMMDNRSTSSQFELFLNILGEHVADMRTWRGWKGTLTGEEGYAAYSCSWRGFEIVLHIAPLLDPDAQRQHVGNDTVIILFKHGEMPDCVFRGKVNACALVVLCDDKREDELLRLASYHQPWIVGFQPSFPASIPLDFSHGALLREALFANAINATYAAAKSGPYRVNRERLFRDALAELITSEGGSAVVTPREGFVSPRRPSAAPPAQLASLPVPPPAQSAGEETPRKPLEHELRVGWLMKRRHKFTGKSAWKKRWVVLTAEELLYHEHDGDEALGSVSIIGATVELVASGGRKGNPTSVLLTRSDGERYEFASVSPPSDKADADVKAWFVALVECVTERTVAAPVSSSGGGVAGNEPTVAVDAGPTLVELPHHVALAMELVVDRGGLFLEGILRDNVGDSSKSDELCAGWKRGERPDLDDVDTLTMGAALRKYLSDERFLSIDQYEVFIKAHGVSSDEERLEMILPVVRSSALLMRLLEFLALVWGEAEVNSMTAARLAALFVPAFLRADQESAATLLSHTKAVTSLVELLVRHCQCCRLTNEDGWSWSHVSASEPPAAAAALVSPTMKRASIPPAMDAPSAPVRTPISPTKRGPSPPLRAPSHAAPRPPPSSSRIDIDLDVHLPPTPSKRK